VGPECILVIGGMSLLYEDWGGVLGRGLLPDSDLSHLLTKQPIVLVNNDVQGVEFEHISM